MIKHLLVAFLVLACVGMDCCAESSEIKITNPLNSTSVSSSITVEGTSKNISAEQAFWIMVYPEGVDRYYPQDIKNDMGTNGNWSMKNVGIGSNSDNGRVFKILAVLANETANEAIVDYLNNCKITGSWPGMESLPDGAVVYDYVSVIRK